MVSEMKIVPNLHPEVKTSLYAHTSVQISEEEARRVAHMANIDLEALRKRGEAHVK